MEIKKPDTNQGADTVVQENLSQGEKQGSGLFIFAIALLVLTVAAALYLSFSKTAISNDQKQLDADITSIQSQLQELKDQKLEAAQVSKNLLASVEKDEIHWSQVIKSVQNLVPVDAITLKQRFKFLSYAGTADGKLSLNVQTTEGLQDPFGEVANLVKTFKSLF